jgi:hypothetical protein
MEHIPPEFHDKISSFLVKRTGKYLLFSAAQVAVNLCLLVQQPFGLASHSKSCICLRCHRQITRASIFRGFPSTVPVFLLTGCSCGPSQPGQHGRGHIPESSRTPDEWIAIFQKKGLYYLPQMSQKLKKAAYAIWSHRENIFAMGVSPDLDNDSPVDSRVHWNRQEESLVYDLWFRAESSVDC